MTRRPSPPRPALDWPQRFPVPLTVKVLSIGLIAASLAGAMVSLANRRSAKQALYREVTEETVSRARSLALALERPMVTEDLVSVGAVLEREQDTHADTRYAVVSDHHGDVVAYTFDAGIPTEIQEFFPPRLRKGELLQAFRFGDGVLVEAHVTIAGGAGGSVRLGVDDRTASQALDDIDHGLWRSLPAILLVCLAGVAMLTYLVLRPTHLLVEETRRLRRRIGLVDEMSGDEIGALAATIEQLHLRLEERRQRVQQKENSRLQLLEKVISSQEEERKRIARELHDQLGQSLSAVMMSISSARGEGRGDPELLEDLEARVRELIDEVRTIAWNLRPSILDDLGLDSTLARYVADVAELADFETDYQYVSAVEGSDRLDPGVELVLYRIAQEAMTNVVRHSRATRVSVVLIRGADEVTLLVEDDGIGFDPTATQWSSDVRCLGLIGMEERLQLYRGTLNIESSPRRGTTIRARIPTAGHPPA